MAGAVLLREVFEADLPTFFSQHLDPAANHMAAFTAKDPADKAAFNAHWRRILAEESIVKRTILFAGRVAGHVLSYEQSGRREVGYWLGREYWGQGIATRALSQFLVQLETRPLYARAAKDNIGSLRVLAKCGFSITGEEKGYANARGREVEEYVLKLAAAVRPEMR